jgi:tetratricopeptide (TPR) repeat protein
MAVTGRITRICKTTPRWKVKIMTQTAQSGLKLIAALLCGAALGFGVHVLTRDDSGSLIPPVLENHAYQTLEGPLYHTMENELYQPTGYVGNYLAGLYAQRHHDWNSAYQFMQQNLKLDKDDSDLIKRAIMLSIGAGEYDQAFTLAHKLADQENNEAISQMFLTVEAFKKKDFDTVEKTLASMQNGGITDFIKPLMNGWVKAAEGKLEIESLRKNSIHYAHAVLIAHYLKNNEKTDEYLTRSIAMGGFTMSDLKRAGDIYADIGQTEKAKEVYEQITKFNPTDSEARANLAALENDKPIDGFKGISSPEDGVALALYDMAKLFYQEGGDDSAHIFAHMSLYLNPTSVETHILLAGIASRNERYDDAIAYYRAIPAESTYYLEAQREIATILEQSGRTEEAIATLKNMAETHQDWESLIKIGDIYRRQENYKDAIKAYNTAYKTIGEENILPDYWHLYYVRGMALERDGQWSKAEADLKKALEFNPDHPYVLNYLGYAWADQGQNLDQAKKMIEKALSLEPEDGYITDSLGWILYRTGEFKQAVKYLEKAVELLPYDAVINDHLGDAYWKVGRKNEARFQWERAKNHIENDDTLLAQIETKLEYGLKRNDNMLKQAKNEAQHSENTDVKDTRIP